MPETYRNPENTLHPEELPSFLINRMGLSSDITIAPFSSLLMTATAGLSERSRTMGYVTPPESLPQIRRRLAHYGVLPAHLSDPAVFDRRFEQLFGTHPDEVPTSEVARTVRQMRPTVPKEEMKDFEYKLASLWFEENKDSFKDKPLQNTFSAASTVDAMDGKVLRTGDGLDQELPRKHAGVIQCTPMFTDLFSLCKRAQAGIWNNVAVLHSTHFSQRTSRLLATETFNMSEKRIFSYGDTVVEGAQTLRDEMKGNKRLKAGFGALIMSNIEFLPIEQTEAIIEIAPSLLAARGVLLLSGQDKFDHGGSIFQLINHARRVFGRDPETIGMLTTQNNIMYEKVFILREDDGNGRQAAFINC